MPIENGKRATLLTARRVRRSIIIALLVFAAWRFFSWPDRPFNVSFQPDEQHRVVAVIDGDTLQLENGDRVRLIGVDTPEFTDSGPQPFAVEATEFARRTVLRKSVRLQFDRERFDKYRRVLAFVYVGDVLLNEELARAGLASVLTKFGYSTRMKKRLLKAQAEAQSAQVGLWATEKTN